MIIILESIFRDVRKTELKESELYSGEKINFYVGNNNSVRSNLTNLKKADYTYNDLMKREWHNKSELTVFSKKDGEYLITLRKSGDCSMIPSKTDICERNSDEIREIISIISGKETCVVCGT